MYKVMVVDDEKFVRKSIINRINWHNLGLEIAGEADNGKTALELIEKNRPDILLVDIKMPIMDGIEFIRSVKQKFPNMRFIILSGYDDFAYTKEAIKLGVDNYIKKPIDEQELEETLLIIKNDFSHKIHNENVMEDFDWKVESRNAELLQERYLNKLIAGDIQVARKNMAFPFSGFTMLILHAYYLQENENFTSSTMKAVMSALSPAAGCLPESGKFKPFVFANEEYPAEIRIILNHELSSASHVKAFAIALKDKVASIMSRNYPDCIINLAISQPCGSLESIPSAYEETLQILKLKILGKDPATLDKSIAIHSDKIFFEYIYVLLKQAGKSLENRNFNDFSRILEKILSSRQNADKFSLKLLENVILELANMQKKLAVKFDADISGQFFSEMFKSHYILKFNSLRELKESISNSFLHFFADSGQLEDENIIARIKQYVAANFEHDLSLQSIAKEFYINPSYLSQLFKSKTGKNLSKYIEDIRIEKAKELLSKTYISVLDVAYHVGYNDANYFSKVFKKKTGMSPSEFQENIYRNV